MALSPVPGFAWDQVETSNGLSHVCMYVCMLEIMTLTIALHCSTQIFKRRIGHAEEPMRPHPCGKPKQGERGYRPDHPA